MKHSESARKLVHIGALAGAALLPWLDWWQAALLATAALAANILVLPYIAPWLLRESDRRGWSGVRFYPVAVLGLVLAFPARLDIVAAAWGIMAGGDGLATLAGHRWPAARLPWNPRKTWSGSLAFLVGGIPAAVAAGAWVAPSVGVPPDPGFTVWAAVAATLVGAIVETLPIRLDDNISVPVAAGATLLLATFVEPGALADAWPGIVAWLPWALALNAALAALAAWTRSLTQGGAAMGAALGTLIYLGGGPGGWLLLGVTFALAVASSRIGRRRQEALGIVEPHGGRRTAGNALANCLVGAVGAALMIVRPDAHLGFVVLVAGLTAGASDTVASEIGKAFGGVPRALPSLRLLSPGDPGGVTALGLAAGIGAACAMATAAVALVPGFTARLIGDVVVAATLGAGVESLLAGWLEPDGFVNNDVLNLVNTAVAAVVAVSLGG